MQNYWFRTPKQTVEPCDPWRVAGSGYPHHAAADVARRRHRSGRVDGGADGGGDGVPAVVRARGDSRPRHRGGGGRSRGRLLLLLPGVHHRGVGRAPGDAEGRQVQEAPLGRSGDVLRHRQRITILIALGHSSLSAVSRGSRLFRRRVNEQDETGEGERGRKLWSELSERGD